MDYKKPTPEESFSNWTLTTRWKIEILMNNGFTKDQAIEMLKVYMLCDLEIIGDAINNL